MFAETRTRGGHHAAAHGARPGRAGVPGVVVCVGVLVMLAACATRTPPALPATLAYPEFVAPAVPPGSRLTPGAARVDAGWRYLQHNNLRNAAREFNAALKRDPAFHPAMAGEGYVALARRDYDRALKAFDGALRVARDYAPAHAGRGQVLLALRRDGEALAAFEAALAVDASLTEVRRRVEVLRFRSLQELIEAARAAAAAGRTDEARAAYVRALDASPESAFLHRELGVIEQRQGQLDTALTHLRRASELDPADVPTLLSLAELLERRRDFAGAEAAYRRAATLDADAVPATKLAEIAELAREALLPAEFQAIPESTQITRGDLAALIGVRLEDVLRDVPERQIVLTDTRDHWAAPWITPVARTGVIEPFENHTFQPRSRVRRGDLAAAVSRIVSLIAAKDSALRERLTRRPAIADLSQGHLRYAAVSAAVASGVMPLLEDDRFQVGRGVSGAEAIDVVARLRALARNTAIPGSR